MLRARLLHLLHFYSSGKQQYTSQVKEKDLIELNISMYHPFPLNLMSYDIK